MRIPGQRNPLTSDHMHLMRIPKRYWGAKYRDIESIPLREAVSRYLRALDDRVTKGQGFYVFGSSGVGKTAAAVVVAKEARRRGVTAFFVDAEHLREAGFSREVFDGDVTLWDRAVEVDLLVLDDLGGECENHHSTARFSSLLRRRASWRRITVVTTQLSHADLEERYGRSLLKTLKETMVAVKANPPPRLTSATEEQPLSPPSTGS